MNILEFLNSQSDDRLAGYAIVFLIALSIVVAAIAKIFEVFNKNNKK